MSDLTQQEKDDVVGRTLKKQEEEIARLHRYAEAVAKVTDKEISRLKAENDKLKESAQLNGLNAKQKFAMFMECGEKLKEAKEQAKTFFEAGEKDDKEIDYLHGEVEAAEKERDSWKTQWVECCENLDIVAKERDRYKAALKEINKDVCYCCGAWHIAEKVLIPCPGTEHIEEICAHGKGLNDYCLPCGRVHSE